jgi:uncharacterized protein (UPF0332 family)
MSVTPENFLESARTLSTQRDEISYRNCISRAYYGSYHKATTITAVPRPALDDERKVGMHKRYIDYLLQFERNSTERKIGLKLQILFNRRIIADYQLELEVFQHDVLVQLNTAADVFNLATPA